MWKLNLLCNLMIVLHGYNKKLLLKFNCSKQPLIVVQSKMEVVWTTRFHSNYCTKVRFYYVANTKSSCIFQNCVTSIEVSTVAILNVSCILVIHHKYIIAYYTFQGELLPQPAVPAVRELPAAGRSDGWLHEAHRRRQWRESSRLQCFLKVWPYISAGWCSSLPLFQDH